MPSCADIQAQTNGDQAANHENPLGDFCRGVLERRCALVGVSWKAIQTLSTSLS